MIKIIQYSLIIATISIFTLVSVDNLSAEIIKTINNKKYICKPSPEGKNLICKKVPVATKSKNSTTHKNSAVKKTHQKKHVDKQAVKKQSHVTAPRKISPKVVPAVTTQPIAKSNEKIASKPTNPLILVNQFEEDPIFLASITGILYGVNEGIKIINVASIDESKDLILQSYKLLKTSSMWGSGAVFISESDKEKIESTIIIAKSKNNQFFVTQNLGVLTLIQDTIGLSDVRKVQRVNFKSKTLNGRDVEYLIGAKLIDNPANFDIIGEKIDINKLNKINYTPLKNSNNEASSLFVVEDKHNGNIFTFITSDQFNKFKPYDNDSFKITLYNGENILLETDAIYKNSLTYIGGNEAIILYYKSSIGTYVAVKNIQNNELSKLQNIDKNYKVEITPIGKDKSIDVSNIKNRDSNTQNLISSTDKEIGSKIPYYQQKITTSSIDVEDSVQNPDESNVKDLQQEKKSVNSEIKQKNEKPLTNNETKNIYPSASKNNLNLEPDVDINKEDIIQDEFLQSSPYLEEAKKNEIQKHDNKVKELETKKDAKPNNLDTMIDKDF